MKQQDVPRLGQSLMTKEQIKRVSETIVLASKNRKTENLSNENVSLWRQELDFVIKDLMQLSGDPCEVVLKQLYRTNMHYNQVVKYYSKHKKYPK